MSCSEFLSPDVSGVVLKINSPSDSLFSRPKLLSFWWEADRLAEAYRIQVVEPDFNTPSLLLDTLIIGNRLDINLDEGLYAWRLRAENAGSISTYITRTLVLDQSPPIGAISLSPLDSSVVNPQGLTLRWQSQDFPLAGYSFPVRDSVYLYRLLGNARLPLSSYHVGFNEIREIQPGTLVTPDSADYLWEITTFDRAGNASSGASFVFFVR